MTDPTTKPDAAPTKAIARRRRSSVPATPLNFSTVEGMEGLQRLTSALASSSIVPEAFRGKAGSEGWSNTLIALELANRLGYPPLLVMQNLTVVKGKTGWLGSFYVALVQSGGAFRDHAWEWQGAPGSDDYGARFVAVRISDGRRCEGTWVTYKMAKQEGWVSNPKWQSMTAQMLIYRSAAFWARQWNPGATMGMRAAEELEDATEEAPVAAPMQLPVQPPPAAKQTLEAEVERPEPPAPQAEAPAPTPPPIHQHEAATAGKAVREAIARQDWRTAIRTMSSMTDSPELVQLRKEYEAARYPKEAKP